MDQNHNSNSTIDIQWDERTLCSDESCIGIIGPDGCCKECGKPVDPTDAKKQEPVSFESTETDVLPDEPSPVTEDHEELEPDISWQNRQLCSDESCIGIIGTNGCCKECGNSAKKAD
jgi:hypothetical protein